jgi:hypothetical protein
LYHVQAKAITFDIDPPKFNRAAWGGEGGASDVVMDVNRLNLLTKYYGGEQGFVLELPLWPR